MENNSERRKYVFISYSTKEAEIASKVCSYLEKNGISCWIAPRNVDAGGDYPSQIVAAIKNCEMLVLLASENTNASGHVSNEVSIAFDSKKIIIPFKLQHFNFTDEFLYFLGRKHWIEASVDIESAMTQLKDTVMSLSDNFSRGRMANIGFNDRSNSFSEKTDSEVYERELGGSYDRESITELIIEKTKKYPYNIYSKISSEEKYNEFMINAVSLFKETLTAFYHNRPIEVSDNIVDLIVNELSDNADVSIQVQGLPGSAKNMLLQLAFYKMLDNFKRGKSDSLPFYVSASYYEKLKYEPYDVAKQMRDKLSEEFREFFAYVRKNGNVKPVLLIEAIREHNVAKVSPENVVHDLWRGFGKFNRICAVDVGLIKNRSRLKRIIPLVGDNKGYFFVTKQVPVEDKAAVYNLIESVFKIYNYELDVNSTYNYIKKFKFYAVDIFLVRLIAKEMRSSYGQDEIRLADIYEKLALSELDGDAERLKNISEELFDYVFDQSYVINSSEYNAAMWSLPHKHNTYLEFLIAYYFMYRIENYKDYNEHRFFATMLTDVSNRFMVSFLKDNYQDIEGLQIMRTLGRNMAYMLKCLEAGRKNGVQLPEREEQVETNFIR